MCFTRNKQGRLREKHMYRIVLIFLVAKKEENNDKTFYLDNLKYFDFHSVVIFRRPSNDVYTPLLSLFAVWKFV